MIDRIIERRRVLDGRSHFFDGAVQEPYDLPYFWALICTVERLDGAIEASLIESALDSCLPRARTKTRPARRSHQEVSQLGLRATRFMTTIEATVGPVPSPDLHVCAANCAVTVSANSGSGHGGTESRLRIFWPETVKFGVIREISIGAW